jgi:predicted DNA-binding transcriptional regulator AlpA
MAKILLSQKSQDRLMNAAQVRAFFGGVSDMCLWRWIHSPDKGFPQPTVINKRRYWRASEIEAFVAAHEQAK